MRTWFLAAAAAALLSTPAMAQSLTEATTKHDHHGADDLAETDVQSQQLQDAHDNYKTAVSQLCAAETGVYKSQWGDIPANTQARCETAHRAAQVHVSNQLQNWLSNPLIHATTRGAPDDADESQVE